MSRLAGPASVQTEMCNSHRRSNTSTGMDGNFKVVVITLRALCPGLSELDRVKTSCLVLRVTCYVHCCDSCSQCPPPERNAVLDRLCNLISLAKLNELDIAITAFSSVLPSF